LTTATGEEQELIRHIIQSALPRAFLLGILLASLALLGSSPASAHAAASPDDVDWAAIDAYVAGEMQAMRVPGLALAIVHGDQIVHQRGFGAADPAGRPVTPQTPFILGSSSKSFTALAIMQLVEAGRIELDAPVQQYLPWFRVADADACARITVRHLLTHTSGLPTSAGSQAFLGDGTQTPEQLVRELSEEELTEPVGEVWQYSNAGYAVLGLIVQTVAGQSYGQYVQEHVFEPLGMQHSHVSRAAAVEDGLASGHQAWFGLPFPVERPYLPAVLPAGFVVSSAEDLGHYLIAQLNDGQAGEASVISPDGLAELHRPAVPLSSTSNTSYGLGWFVGPFGGVPAIHHGGDLYNYHADMVLLPEGRWGVVVLTNTNHLGLLGQGDMSLIAGNVTRLLVDREPVALTRSYLGYAVVGAILLLHLALDVWLLVALRRSWQQLQRRPRPWSLPRMLVLPLLYQLIGPVVLLVILPLAGVPPARTMSHLLMVSPEVASLILVSTALNVVGVIARVTLIVRALPLTRPARVAAWPQPSRTAS
jgi:CubicO group peptidase (beta-lactamase class C family)